MPSTGIAGAFILEDVVLPEVVPASAADWPPRTHPNARTRSVARLALVPVRDEHPL